jgi:hypothetical protein
MHALTKLCKIHSVCENIPFITKMVVIDSARRVPVKYDGRYSFLSVRLLDAPRWVDFHNLFVK